MKKLIKILFLTTLALLISCEEGDRYPYDIDFPKEGKVSFVKHVQPFLQLRCATEGACHQSNYRRADYDLTQFLTIMGKPALINTENPEISLIYQVVNADNPHLSNLRLIPVRQDQIDGILRWIEQGALPD
jgi:hypothetical protein